jgi:hypothetical protein
VADEPKSSEAADEPKSSEAADEPKSSDAADEPKSSVAADEPKSSEAADKQKSSDAADKPKSSDAADAHHGSTKAKVLRVSVSVRTLAVGTLVAVLLASVGIMAWLYLGARARLDGQARQAANASHAEKVALDYAVGAARVDFKNLDAWKKNLVNGTTPELKEKLDSAGTSMEQILVPMQWNSTATPLVAKVRSNTNGIYVVDAFVGVLTKTMQAPDGLQSTATYSITIDSNHDWQISDVGGIGTVVGQK